MKPRIVFAICFSLAAILLQATNTCGQASGGHLLIVGGGLRPSNTVIYRRFLGYAGGKEAARIGVMPTASAEPASAEQLTAILGKLGVAAEQIQLVDIRVGNATVTAHDPNVIKQISDCTGILFQGGDQKRITQALMPGGKETPALAAIRGVLKKGGVIAGSSAGAAAQSKTMISVSGLPDDSLDEGLDALDFGITRHGTRRGLLVSPGLAFFDAGIIDQHFSQYRGRLGRLARAACECGERYGFGIDENTGIDVAPDGSFEVLGEGSVTIVDASHANCRDGALGCSISNLRVSVLKEGDRFDPKTGAKLAPYKKRVLPGKEAYNGNFLISDISGSGAVASALFSGLGDNTSRKQIGVTLKHHPTQAHGYRFIFRKTDATQFLEGRLQGVYANALLDAQLDIEPIGSSLRNSEHDLPRDLPLQQESSRIALAAMWRRGILCQDEAGRLRPSDRITRAELAWAIAHTIALEPVRANPPVIADLVPEAFESESILLVVGQQLMELDDEGRFHPDANVPLEESAQILMRLAERYSGESISEGPLQAIAHEAEELKDVTAEYRKAVAQAILQGLLQLEDVESNPREPLARRQTAEAIYKLIAFSWSND